MIALLCGTVAALRGDDVRAAMVDPKPEKLATLIPPEAASAMREVLLTIEVADLPAVETALRAAGLQ